MAIADQPVLGMILKGYPRISETFISNEIALMEKLGFSIHIYSMRRPRENFSHESVKQIRATVDYLPETLLEPLPIFLYHNFKLAGKKPQTYRKAFMKAIRRFSQTRRMATFKHFFQAGYLVNKLLAEKPVIHLHAHFAHSPASVAMFANQLAGIPFSFTAHAKDIYTSHPEHLIEKIRLSRFIVTCTEYNKHYLESLSPFKTGSIYRIYHGIDIDLFSDRNEKIQPSEPYQLLTVARLIKKKGLPTVCRAIRILCDKNIPVRYTLIGDGEERKKILSLIKRLKIDKVTRLLGTLPHEEVLDHYRKADLFVLGCEIAPDGDRDGIPNVLLESMAMGVPVVITRESAIPEVVIHGKTGLLVPPGKPEQMAEAMAKLLTDTRLRQSIIPAAKNQVIQHFDNKTLIQELAAIYRERIPEFKAREAKNKTFAHSASLR
ncbi:MAG: glycosyltransferase family 4 protein [Deltaproteobacteria bacterium]|nr:glycosyltransferase family 4 protein [Deltaproteobacteria bacterium]MBW1963301.1 glycosyltransferase family 4 protein [Deltaproteobacteria bacterium]MBW2154580.1 glycosyltransferase family 4 protein [Deltaproteobacteria bacterium]